MNDVTRRVAPALMLGESLMRMLTDPNISAEKMQIIIQMQRDLIAESRREAFQAAFAQMAPELPHVNKRGVVELQRDGKKLGNYRYMKYEDMDEVIRPILHRHGFGLSFATKVEDGKTILTGELVHEAGHSKPSTLALPPDTGPGRNTLQAQGSTLSYSKRYIAELLLNIVRKDVDDDAIAGGLKLVTPEQVDKLGKLLEKTKTEVKNFLTIMCTGVGNLSDIPARDYGRLENALNAKLQAMANKNGTTKKK